MASIVLPVVAGLWMVQQWQRLPNLIEAVLLFCLAIGFACKRLWPVSLFLFGLLWAAAYGQACLSDRLADHLQNRVVQIEGYVAAPPRQAELRQGFDFIVSKAPSGVPAKLRLNWYRPGFALRAGQDYRLQVKLKQPRGLSNPGGFDYETWLFANRIGATGYLRAAPQPVATDLDFSPVRWLALARQALSDRLDNAMAGSRQLGVVKALSLGLKDEISRTQWQAFTAAGIVHLLVISGGHISLVAGLVFVAARKFWAYTGIFSPAPQTLAAAFAWVSALFYAGLAGFSLPVQRAFLMLTVAMAALVLQRKTSVAGILLTALLAVTLFDPLATLAVGFWLSFGAVALLAYLSAARLGRFGFWRQAAGLHFGMAVGMAPFLIAFFQQVSLLSPLANMLAVPLVGFVLLPLCLSACGLLFVWPELARTLLFVADTVLQTCDGFLQQMAAWPLATVTIPPPSWPGLLLGLSGVLLLLAPKGMPTRYLSPFLLLPLFFSRPDRPAEGEFRLALLDVGQGLSAVIETSGHTLVFDAGAKYDEQSDMGARVLLPFLRYRGIGRVDRLVVSHGDNDHSGGAGSLLAGIQVDSVYSSVAPWAETAGGGYCRAGQNWNWDGVRFEMLAPGKWSRGNENDRSCVLKVGAKGQTLLLTGDIESQAEASLVQQYGPALASSIMIAPHHGSKTSSSAAFIGQVAPQWIFIPAGYGNRFGFPHESVLARYRALGSEVLTTGDQGCIVVASSGSNLRIESSRQAKRYWSP